MTTARRMCCGRRGRIGRGMAARRDDIWSGTGREVSTAYLDLRDGKHPVDRVLHDHIDRLWVKYRGISERNFVQGFAIDPDARLWEMALACHFLDLGKEIIPGAKKKTGGPDLCLGQGQAGGRVWVEAVCPQNTDNELDRVPLDQKADIEQEAGYAPVREVQLRILSSLKSKRNVCADYVSSENIPVRPEDPFVIAVSTGSFGPRGALDSRSGFSGCVLPIDGEYFEFDVDGAQLVCRLSPLPSIFSQSKRKCKPPRTLGRMGSGVRDAHQV